MDSRYFWKGQKFCHNSIHIFGQRGQKLIFSLNDLENRYKRGRYQNIRMFRQVHKKCKVRGGFRFCWDTIQAENGTKSFTKDQKQIFTSRNLFIRDYSMTKTTKVTLYTLFLWNSKQQLNHLPNFNKTPNVFNCWYDEN